MWKLEITVNNKLILRAVPDNLMRDLINRFTIDNPKWIENDRMGRWNGDTEEDLDMMQEIYRNLYREGEVIETRMALAFLEKHPEIAARNKNIRQKNWKEL